MAVFIPHHDSCITYRHLRVTPEQRKQEGRGEFEIKGGAREQERSASLHHRILSDCLDRLVEFKMQQGPVMWQ